MAEEIKNTGLNSFEGAENDSQYLLVVKDLKKYFPIKSSFFKKTIGHVKAVDGISFGFLQYTANRINVFLEVC